MLKSKVGEIIKNSPYNREYIRKKMGVTANTMSNWCTGKTYLSMPQAYKLGAILNVKINEFYEYEEDIDER